ncbi:hypothetical protein KBI5_24450 [Frankia sp. KB5]|nr:hypothetical protein KBI5_24450 [Frankia sp. KB5]
MADPPTDALVAEVVARPRIPVLATIAPPTGVASIRIPVGFPARPGDLRLDDLLLVADAARLTLWSRDRRCQVVPVLNSRIGPRYLPAEARLLALLGRSGCRPWRLFSCGSLRDTAFQPRVRYRSTILAPARWRLPRLLYWAAGWCWCTARFTAPPAGTGWSRGCASAGAPSTRSTCRAATIRWRWLPRRWRTSSRRCPPGCARWAAPSVTAWAASLSPRWPRNCLT